MTVNIGLNAIISSFICSSIFHPIDTIKVRLQGSKRPLTKNIYKGISLRYVTAGVQSLTFWTTYEELKKTKKIPESAALASLLASAAETPFDIMKRRAQLCKGPISYRSMYHYILLNTLANVGISTSYHSLLEQVGPLHSGFITSILTYPIDTLKTITIAQKFPKQHELFLGFLFKICYITGYLNLNTYMMNSINDVNKHNKYI